MAIEDTTDHGPVVAATSARQGRWGKHVLWVLIVSTVLAALVLMATWGLHSGKLASVQDNNGANTQAEAAAGDTPQSPAKQN